jgi:hypothetical protein
MALAAVRLCRVAIAAQIRRDHGEALGQPGRDLVPGEVRLRVAVQQQERRPAPACRKVDTGACGLDIADLKARKKVSCPLSVV